MIYRVVVAVVLLLLLLSVPVWAQSPADPILLAKLDQINANLLLVINRLDINNSQNTAMGSELVGVNSYLSLDLAGDDTGLLIFSQILSDTAMLRASLPDTELSTYSTMFGSTQFQSTLTTLGTITVGDKVIVLMLFFIAFMQFGNILSSAFRGLNTS